MGSKMRHELKHIINAYDCEMLRLRLRQATLPDPFSDEDGGYDVHSLYFDTPTDRALREKIDGVDPRAKFRIRYYNQNLNFMRLEKKCKVAGLTSKYGAKISAEQCQAILNGEERWFEGESELLCELYAQWQSSGLRPREIVSYHREAFVYPAGNVRITIDSDLRRGSDVSRFLNLECETTPVYSGTILEVKYDEFLPQFICDLVRVPNRRASAFSKYAVCRGNS